LVGASSEAWWGAAAAVAGGTIVTASAEHKATTAMDVPMARPRRVPVVVVRS
jgi:hypothetical protein